MFRHSSAAEEGVDVDPHSAPFLIGWHVLWLPWAGPVVNERRETPAMRDASVAETVLPLRSRHASASDSRCVPEWRRELNAARRFASERDG